MRRALPLLVAFLALLLAPALAGCPAERGCAVASFERSLSFAVTSRAVSLHLFREHWYAAQRQTLPELGLVPEETGGGLRRVVLALDSPERLAVVLEPASGCTATWTYSLDCQGFTRSELEGAAPGATLPSGGILVGVVAGRGRLELRAPLPSGRLTLVRLDPPPAGGAVTVDATARFEFNAPLTECLVLAHGSSTARCGNGLIDPQEECDDENAVTGDGCSSDCRREAPYCTAAGQLWMKACDDGEPSRCESRACLADDPDPRCAARAELRAATFVEGRFGPGEAVTGRLRSTPAGLDCACGQNAIGQDAERECAAGCVVELPACATGITAEAGAAAPLASWGGRCWGTGACWAPGLEASTVVATFATATPGLDLARALVESPPGANAPTPAATAATADGGLLVAFTFSAPLVFAGATLTADGPAAALARLAADGSLAWLRRLSVRPGEELFLHAVAATPDGGAVLAGSFRGRLDASGLDVPGGAGSFRELFVAAYDDAGAPRFARRVELAAPYWTSQAALAVDGATIALAATVTLAATPREDLALVALDQDGVVSRTRLLLDGAPAGDDGRVLGRGVGLLPGGDWLVAGVHAATTDAGGLLPPRESVAWLHFVSRLAPELSPVWATAVGETADATRPSACAADPVGPGAWYTLPREPAGTHLVRLDGAGAVTWSTPVSAAEAWTTPRLAVDPATGDALVAGNGAAWVAEVGSWETWLARLTAGGDLVYTERHSGPSANALRLETLAVSPAGRPLWLASYRTSLTLAGTTLRGCDSPYNTCTSLALLGAAP